MSCLKQLKEKLSQSGRKEVGDCSLLAAASTLRSPGKGVFAQAYELALKSCILAPMFSRFDIRGGKVFPSDDLFDCRKLRTFLFSVDAADVPSSNNHPFSDWMDRLKDYTGTHGLSPAPLVPWIVHSGTVLHSLSCCLVGVEMYWHALAHAVQAELQGANSVKFDRILRKMSSDVEGAWQQVLSCVRLNAGDCPPGGEVEYHPVILQAAANVLQRVIVLLDILASDQEKRSRERRWRETIFIPWTWEGGGKEEGVQKLPPLFIAWEGEGRCIPLTPSGCDKATCFFPDQFFPQSVFFSQENLAAVKSKWLPLDGKQRAQLSSSSSKSMKWSRLRALNDVMGGKFHECTGLALQTVCDFQALLLDLDVHSVSILELLQETRRALKEERLFYDGVSCQLTPTRGLWSRQDLARGGKLYESAMRLLAMTPDPSNPVASTGRSAGGIRLIGIDIPTQMSPGKLRVFASVMREEEDAPEFVIFNVRNVAPSGHARNAKISKQIPTILEETALGIEVPLSEEGKHTIQLSLSPATPQTEGAPVSVFVLDAGEFHIDVQQDLTEKRTNIGVQGAENYADGILLPEENLERFVFVGGVLKPKEIPPCRMRGIKDDMRPVDIHGVPQYQDGDCTLNSSAPGSCCDRKHWWAGREYDNYPIIFRLSLNCPTHFEPSGKAVVTIIWHEGESNPQLNTTVYHVASNIVQTFWPDEPECPWWGWESQLNEVILRELPPAKSRKCPRRSYLDGYVGGVDVNY